MTKAFNQKIHCQHCRRETTIQSAFSRWIMTEPELDSGDGICVIDQDFWVHRFKAYYNKSWQLMMLVEVKTNSASPSPAQDDTLGIVDQAFRSDRKKVVSRMSGKDVYVDLYGSHVLRFSGTSPDDSEIIWWDGRVIRTDTLISLLRFDRNPDTLELLIQEFRDA